MARSSAADGRSVRSDRRRCVCAMGFSAPAGRHRT
jgi:hypothetical protein